VNRISTALGTAKAEPSGGHEPGREDRD